MATIVMAGGGTGGHVMPLLAVARELEADGHQSVFIGTRNGFEAKLVPPAGFPLEFIEIGGLNRVGVMRTIRSLAQLPFSVLAFQAIARQASAFGGLQPGWLCGRSGGAGRAVEKIAA